MQGNWQWEGHPSALVVGERSMALRGVTLAALPQQTKSPSRPNLARAELAAVVHLLGCSPLRACPPFLFRRATPPLCHPFFLPKSITNDSRSVN